MNFESKSTIICGIEINENSVEINADTIKEVREYCNYKSLDGSPRLFIFKNLHLTKEKLIKQLYNAIDKSNDCKFVFYTRSSSNIPRGLYSRSIIIKQNNVSTNEYPEAISCIHALLKKKDISILDIRELVYNLFHLNIPFRLIAMSIISKYQDKGHELIEFAANTNPDNLYNLEGFFINVVNIIK